MPWINKEMCTGCGVCIDDCPVAAITLESDGAIIDEKKCIRCGICHDVCPADASRHDGERVPAEIEAKLAWAKNLMEHEYYAGNPELKEGLKDRLRRNMIKDKKVLEQALERLAAL